jgi:hypothetical protein
MHIHPPLGDISSFYQCQLAATPVDTMPKVVADGGHPVSDPSKYSLANGLQYLTMTRQDLIYAVQQECLHMYDPRDCHLAIIKWILRYVRVPQALVFFFLLRQAFRSSPTLMQTGSGAPTRIVRPPDTTFILAVHLSAGHPNANLLSRDRAPRQSTVRLPRP